MTGGRWQDKSLNAVLFSTFYVLPSTSPPEYSYEFSQ